MTDIGPNFANPKEIKSQVVDATKNGILFNSEAPRPTEPLAAANHEWVCLWNIGLLISTCGIFDKGRYLTHCSSVYQAFRDTCRPGTFRRFVKDISTLTMALQLIQFISYRLAESVGLWLDNILKQTQIRAGSHSESSEDFLIRRRATSGGYTVWSESCSRANSTGDWCVPSFIS